MIERAAFLKGLIVATGGLDIWDPPDPELPRAPPTPPAQLPAGSTVRVKVADGSILALDVEKYLYGVVPLESPPSWPAGGAASAGDRRADLRPAEADALAPLRRGRDRRRPALRGRGRRASGHHRPPSTRPAVKLSPISVVRQAFFTAPAAAGTAPTPTPCGDTPA